MKGKGVARAEELWESAISDVPKATRYADTMKVIEDWDRNRAEYELLSKHILSEFEKLRLFRDMLPADLHCDVMAHEKTTYNDALECVTRQVMLRREEERRSTRHKGVRGSDL